MLGRTPYILAAATMTSAFASNQHWFIMLKACPGDADNLFAGF